MAIDSIDEKIKKKGFTNIVNFRKEKCSKEKKRIEKG